ncbi:MAG: 3-hydroxyacyl-CoA dehydrogenase NAD-binding domain-containing protein [Tomitella sp.]|nr:3-hydroxyacyl-CoA dehydrogenase NAD-binding domain-containing protein [Tomitella sp.]
MHEFTRIRIIGAGVMGRGIAQVAAAAGCEVELTDLSPTAVDEGLEFIARMLRRSAEKGLTTGDEAEAAISRLHAGDAPASPSERIDLAIEAVAESLEVKQALFAELGRALPHAALASNTSSLSITTIASVVADPSRVFGLHFFNPVPLMMLVEVVPGLRTSPEILESGRRFVRRTGHTPVQAKDSPGFLVNLLGRGLPTEALTVFGESIADVSDIDRLVRDTLHLRMGPFELMDLTGLDVFQPALDSIWKGFYSDERLRPAGGIEGRLWAGLLGRKTGQGFYRYVDGIPQIPAEPAIPPDPAATPLHVVGGGPLAELLTGSGVTLSDGPRPDTVSIVQPLGRPAYLAAIEHDLDPTRTIGVDPLGAIDPAAGRRGTPDNTHPHDASGAYARRMAVIAPFSVDVDRGRAAVRALASTGSAITVTADGPAPVTQRIIAAMVNVAAMAAEKNLATPEDIDRGAELGLHYPLGPLAMGDLVGPARVLAILDGLLDYTGDPRYRASSWLRARADLGLSLLDPAIRPHDLTS